MAEISGIQISKELSDCVAVKSEAHTTIDGSGTAALVVLGLEASSELRPERREQVAARAVRALFVRTPLAEVAAHTALLDATPFSSAVVAALRIVLGRSVHQRVRDVPAPSERR
jgi:hypothetical protein